jgi:hypothetical protein
MRASGKYQFHVKGMTYPEPQKSPTKDIGQGEAKRKKRQDKRW